MAGRKRNAPAESPPSQRSSPRTTRTTTTTRTTRSSARSASQTAAPQSTSRRTGARRNAPVPDVYREMLVEARHEITAEDAAVPERPAKRKRPGEGRRAEAPKENPSKTVSGISDDDGDLQFEDVPVPKPTIQTIERDSDEDDEDDDIDFEEVPIQPTTSSSAAGGEASKGLHLDLSAHLAALAPRRPDRRKALSREEKDRRVEVHKAHIICLLAHVELRNRWCNDRAVQDALRPLLPQKTVAGLIPRASLNQFGRSESFKRGLQEARDLFKRKFTITERGLRRSLWAEDEEQLKNYQLPDDIESTHEKSDFLEAAKTLRGSRDVGAQLFCALLRSVGVETRLVCSLQPLSFVPGAPSMPKRPKAQTPQKKPPSKAEQYAAALAKHSTTFPSFQAGATTPSPRHRLGHPHAAAYHPPSLPSQPPLPTTQTTPPPKKIRNESPFPVYWIEALDIAHQKYLPLDPLVTSTLSKPHALEPPASDTQNTLTHVLAFSAHSTATDVTRRYAKAYTAKTRKARLPPEHDRWYRRVLSRYTDPAGEDLQQIEEIELASAEAREPMPRNVADFKGHPVYALERHLKRHEVLVPGAQASGTVSVGSGRTGAGVERIYRRRDVRVCRSGEGWLRGFGRVVKQGEEAVKSLKRRRRRNGEEGWDGEGEEDDDPDRVGLFGDAARGVVPLYMLEQTELYVAAPVVRGRVPKNQFGNVEVYVPSMVPPGGVHVAHERAARAAFVLGVDYAPALTGFEFRGRHGTAVLRGVVVPEEAGEAVWAVIRGMEDMEAEEEEERRARRALGMWSRFLKGLRIRERIWAGVDEEAEEEAEDKGKGKAVEEAEDGDVGMEDVGSDDGMGGGFFVPDEEDDGGGGGFFVPDDEDGGGGGGFIVE